MRSMPGAHFIDQPADARDWAARIVELRQQARNVTYRADAGARAW